ncbi:MAG: Maf family protein [Clostridia bacterium]|nr:Maf family protein [Clostridia bacterium]
MEKIVLASASPRRKELLERADLKFTVVPSAGEEEIGGGTPDQVVENLSRSKAFSVAEELKREKEVKLVIGADTIVAFQNHILGKPVDEQDAFDTLTRLSGNSHQVYTGVTVLIRKGDAWEEHTFSERTDVHFYSVSEEEIRDYICTGEPMDKAGSYGIQGRFGVYVKGIEGDYNNVVGLPVGRLFYEMKKIGIDMRGMGR